MFFNDKRKQVLFRSYWVHTIAQLIVLFAFAFLGNSKEAQYLLIILLSPVIIVVYISFQFPIISLLIVFSDNITQKLSKNQDIFFRIILSIGLFIIFASLLSLLILVLFIIFFSNGITFNEVLNFQLTYITPIFLVGEVVRQRLVMKKVFS